MTSLKLSSCLTSYFLGTQHLSHKTTLCHISSVTRIFLSYLKFSWCSDTRFWILVSVTRFLLLILGSTDPAKIPAWILPISWEIHWLLSLYHSDTINHTKFIYWILNWLQNCIKCRDIVVKTKQNKWFFPISGAYKLVRKVGFKLVRIVMDIAKNLSKGMEMQVLISSLVELVQGWLLVKGCLIRDWK